MARLTYLALNIYYVSSCVRGAAGWVRQPPSPPGTRLYSRCSPLKASKEPSGFSLVHRAPRLYLGQAKLAQATLLELGPEQTHYLTKVMRLREGDVVRAFNGRDGEWLCRLVSTAAAPPSKRSKRAMAGLSIESLLRPQGSESTINVTLCFAPIKRTRLKILIEKATELGVTTLQPLNTEFTDQREGHVDDGLNKMQSSVIEAAEQSERLSLPCILPIQSLASYLSTSWGGEAPLYVCRERTGGRPLFQVLREEWDSGERGLAAKHDNDRPSVGFLVGPEGGFSSKELDMLGSLPCVRFVSLGETVLRSETAAIAALGCWAGFPKPEGTS